MEAEAAFERRSRVLFLGVRGDQCGIDIDDQRIISCAPVIRCILTGKFPRLPACLIPGLIKGPHSVDLIGGQGRDQAGYRWIRGHQTIEFGLGP